MSYKLYSNSSNYLYRIGEINLDNKYNYLLFNSYFQYWMPLDDICAEIYIKITEDNLFDNVIHFFCKKYDITSDKFIADTKDFIDTLIEKHFISTTSFEETTNNWMNKQISFEPVYPFNDMYMSLSDHCNLKCIYCFNKKSREKRIKNSNLKNMDLHKMIDVLKQFKEIGGNRVVFTGGEPTLNSNFIKLCENAHSIGLKCTFITNGLRLNHFEFDKLFNAVDFFGISFDSIVSKELMRLWNSKNKNIPVILLKNLMNIDEWVFKNHKELTINIMPIVTKLNMKSLYKLVHSINNNIRHCNIRWSFTKYCSIGTYEIDNMLEVSELEYIDYVRKAMRGVVKDNLKLFSYAYNHSNKKQVSFIPHLLTCAPSFFIATDGSIYPCQGCDESEFLIGNVYDITLEEAYNSEIFKKMKFNIIKNNINKCKECELRFVCSSAKKPCDKESIPDCKKTCIKRMFLEALNYN